MSVQQRRWDAEAAEERVGAFLDTPGQEAAAKAQAAAHLALSIRLDVLAEEIKKAATEIADRIYVPPRHG